MQELKDFLLVKVLRGDIDLDMLCVEEALLGNNARTSSVAYALNFTLDYMIAEDLLKPKRFFRVSNKSWKATLRQETGVSPLKQAIWSKNNPEKEEILQCLQALAHPDAEKWRDFTSFESYLKSGIQDQLDALGLAIHCVKVYGLDQQPQVLSKKTDLKIFTDKRKAEKYVKYPLKIEDLVPVNSLRKWIDTCGHACTESTSYWLEVSKLGSFGIKQGFLEKADQYYIVVNVHLVTE